MTLASSLKYTSTSVPSVSRPTYTPPLSFLKSTRAARLAAFPRLTDGLRSAFGCLACSSVRVSSNVIAVNLHSDRRKKKGRNESGVRQPGWPQCDRKTPQEELLAILKPFPSDEMAESQGNAKYAGETRLRDGREVRCRRDNQRLGEPIEAKEIPVTRSTGFT